MDRGIQPIQEKIYGLASAREDIIEARRTAFLEHGLDPTLPITCIEGRPVGGSGFGGVQIWGVAPHDRKTVSVTTVDCPGAGSGRLWTQKGFRYLYLPAVRGQAPDGTLPADASAQAQRMFLNAHAVMKAHGFSYSNTVRTWIYNRRLLDWYDEFNKARNALYGSSDFFGTGDDVAFPASTGIQGRCLDEECVMDVLVLDPIEPDSVRARPILTSSHQGQPFSYRSAFSRGMSLETNEGRTVLVSGTASIDGAGKSVHQDDPEAQSLQTLLSVAAILDDQGARLEDICSATLFCKDKEAYDAYQRATRLLSIPPFPTISVLADVCRPELLVEIEAVAIIPSGRQDPCGTSP